MSGLVSELQREALDSNIPVTDLLRKASVDARKLGITEFSDWCQNELNGYTEHDDIPDYRKVKGELKAYNPYHGWQSCVIPEEEVEESVCNTKTNQPISGLQALLSDETNFLTIPFPGHVKATLRKVFDCDLEMALHISPNAVTSIVDIVRNGVLDWALRLEEEGILGEGLTFSDTEKKKAQNNPNINIHNFQGVFGNVSDSNVTQELNMNIQQNDFESLAKYLEAQGVDNEDIQELQNALGKDAPPQTAEKFGEMVSGWIGKMTTKAASGIWQINISTAAALLTEAIKAYYGF